MGHEERRDGGAGISVPGDIVMGVGIWCLGHGEDGYGRYGRRMGAKMDQQGERHIGLAVYSVSDISF